MPGEDGTNDSKDIWWVRVIGPDDLLPATGMLDAMNQACNLNEIVLRDMEDSGVSEHTPLCWAVPYREGVTGW